MSERELLGYKIRKTLYEGERSYFMKNPHVAGMAADDGKIILNPFAGPEVDMAAVAKNEALRLYLRDNNVELKAEPTEGQKKSFANTPYGDDPAAMKATILGRIYSGDPSAGVPTKEQQSELNRILNQSTKR